ncbi:MAG: hypothetical protein QXW94_05710, partial [Desulfurococcaceae archaeon]
MSVVIGVRIPKKLKEELEQLGIDYAREIREYLQRRVKEEKAKKLAEALDKLIEQAFDLKVQINRPSDIKINYWDYQINAGP